MHGAFVAVSFPVPRCESHTTELRTRLASRTSFQIDNYRTTMAPKKKGKGKSKSDDGGAADGDGKKKNAPPTEVEREEMRLKITALEQKLASATARLEAQDAQSCSRA